MRLHAPMNNQAMPTSGGAGKGSCNIVRVYNVLFQDISP